MLARKLDGVTVRGTSGFGRGFGVRAIAGIAAAELNIGSSKSVFPP
jgi:hypothetical protein